MHALPLLPATVIGSYSLPAWLVRVRELAAAGAVSSEELREAHDAAVRSGVKDQEMAGVDIVTDGELRRETMVNFFSSRMKGFDMSGRMKAIGNLDPSIQMPDPVIRSRVLPGEGLGMDEHFRFLAANTERLPKVCVTGPHMLAMRATNEWYKDERELVTDIAAVLRGELLGLAAAGCLRIQIDEPVWVGYPGQIPWLVSVFNDMLRGINAEITLHLCYGNYQLKRLFTGQYADLFPALLEVHAGQLSMEFAVNGMRETELFARFPTGKRVVVGVVDVKDSAVETPEVVASRIRAALRHIPADRMVVSPDCGMKFMPRDRAFAKLRAMVDGARIVRRELGAD